MKTISKYLMFLFLLMTMAAIAYSVIVYMSGCTSMSENVKTAKNVDVKRYMGKWYEIARMENGFERGTRNATAFYTFKDNGEIDVVNSAIDGDNELSSVHGSAYAPNPQDPSKLRVTFFYPFYADYFILELDGDYQWALVGGDNMKYLWILSRTPTLPEDQIQKILDLAAARGYDVKNLVFNRDLK